MDDADLKPNLLPVFGGSGGGLSSEFVLPVLFRAGPFRTLSWYLFLINLSIAESASSTSNGIGGLVLLGLYMRFEVTFPIRFIFYRRFSNARDLGMKGGCTSTCSFDQESILNDLTLLMCVPIFRWRAAHRMQRKIPNYPRSVAMPCRRSIRGNSFEK